MLGIKKPGDAAKTAKIREVRAWAREVLGVPPETTVMVTELTCTEPGCPPVETIIAVLHGAGQNRQAKVPRPLSDLTRDDIAALTFAAADGAPTEPTKP